MYVVEGKLHERLKARFIAAARLSPPVQ